MADRPRHMVIVDMQRVFKQAGVWQVPRYDEAAAAIVVLAGSGLQPIATRVVPDPAEHGSWSAYYDRWPTMRLDPSDAVWDLELGIDVGPTVDLPTFSKWGPELAHRIPVGDELVLTGVATDCCVLATALGAVDAGRYVTVVSDASAGQDDRAHQNALTLLELLSPMVRIRTTRELIGQREQQD